MSHPVSTTHRLKMFFISTPANVKGQTELFASATYLTTHSYSSLWRKQYNLVEPPKSWGMCKNGSSVTCKQLGFKILRCGYQIATNNARYSSSKQLWSLPVEIRKVFGLLKKTVHSRKEEISKKHPTMHTNKLWPGECTEEPLTKSDSRSGSRN